MVINVDNVTIIMLCGELDGSTIVIKNHPCQIVLGKYPHSRAKEVFEDMLKKCFPTNFLVTSGLPDDVNTFWDKINEGFEGLMVKDDYHIEQFNIGTYYMPEE